MPARILAIAMNSYREAVRARVLYGLFALALATCGYSMVVATLSLHQEARVIADLGAASISLYAVLVAIVLGATSLHRELELKTIFPILSRPLRRWEYLVGKYLGMLLTLAVFVAVDGAAVLLLLAVESGQEAWKLGAALAVLGGALAVAMWRARYARVFTFVPWAAVLFVAAYLLAAPAGSERQLVVASAALTLSEVAIVAAIATLFASFSSPFLTAVLTLLVFLVGRSADTLARLPPKVFPAWLVSAGAAAARVYPNLQVYVPARPLLLGQIDTQPVWRYVGAGALHAVCYAAVLLVVSAIIFRRRDFQ